MSSQKGARPANQTGAYFRDGDIHVLELVYECEHVPTVPPDLDLTKPPKYSMSAYAKVRDVVFQALSDEAGGLESTTATPGTLGALTKVAAAVLGVNKAYTNAVFDTLSHFCLSHTLDARMLFRMAVRLAGNREDLRKGRVIPMWTGAGLRWACVSVVEASTSQDRPYAKRVRMFAHEGAAAGMEIHQTISDRFIQFMLRQVGYPRFKRFGSDEIMGLWFTCLLGSVDGKPAMTAFKASASQLDRNRELYRMRHGECPKQKVIECSRCESGAGDCPAAVHAAGWVPMDCPGGHRALGVAGATLCASCEETRALKLSFQRRERLKCPSTA